MTLIVDNMRKNKFGWFRHIANRNEWEAVKAEIKNGCKKIMKKRKIEK